MARVTFTPQEWRTIDRSLDAYLASDREPFGLPEHRDGSVVLGTFNIRELGACSKRSPEAWEFLRRTCERFDLLAVQEVQDDLSGIQRLRDLLGGPFELVVSDTTGKTPGRCGCPERLAFLHRSSRVRQTELASDISFDRTDVVSRLFERRDEFARTWAEHQAALDAWKTENERRVAEGKRRTSKPAIRLPTFLTFIRQPHCASFEVMPTPGDLACPLGFLIVNAHLLYGTDRQERRWEFDALIEWLAVRAKQRDVICHDNILMMGDCNLEFEHIHETRAQIDALLRRLNAEKLKSRKAAKANFPFLDPHPNPERNPPAHQRTAEPDLRPDRPLLTRPTCSRLHEERDRRRGAGRLRLRSLQVHRPVRDRADRRAHRCRPWKRCVRPPEEGGPRLGHRVHPVGSERPHARVDPTAHARRVKSSAVPPDRTGAPSPRLLPMDTHPWIRRGHGRQ